MVIQVDNSPNKGAARSVGLVERARKLVKKDLTGVAVFSLVINILMLTGPIYMLQVYDRVLTSRSMSTLVAITVLMVGLFTVMGFIDLFRSRVLARTGLKMEQAIGPDTLRLWLLRGNSFPKGMPSPLNDVTTIRKFLTGSAPSSFFDIPWTPIYLGIIFLLHPLLGLLGTVGAVVLIIVSLINDRAIRKNTKALSQINSRKDVLAHQGHESYETVLSMGMRPQLVDQWTALNSQEQVESAKVSDTTGASLAFSKTFRMIIQSAILGLGGGLALMQVISPGAMIAASILLGRALGPVQSVIGQWGQFKSAQASYNRLSQFHIVAAEQETGTNLPRPKGNLTLENVAATPPGVKKVVLEGINVKLPAGQAMAVIGPSASGKSSLAKLLVGIWMPRAGHVRLDGATLDQWRKDDLGRYIGYLPQSVTLFSGTIGQNIARFAPDATEETILAAAQEAGVHDMILRMPQGYDTLVVNGGENFSGGQMQLIGLARALYGQPCFVVLDEPNSNLDNTGEQFLKTAIERLKARGASVVVIAHRAGVLNAVDYLLVLEQGKQVAFGPRQAVYKFLNARNQKPNQGAGRPGPNPNAQPAPVQQRQQAPIAQPGQHAQHAISQRTIPPMPPLPMTAGQGR